MREAERHGPKARRSVPLWAVLLGPPIVLAALAAIAFVSLEVAGILALAVLVIGYVFVLWLMKRGADEVFEYRQSKAYREHPAATPNNFLGYLAHAADRGRATIERRAAKQRRPSP